MNAAALETENDELRDKLAALQDDFASMKEKKLEVDAHVKALVGEKSKADADVRLYRKKVEELEQVVRNTQDEARSNIRKSQESVTANKDVQKQALQLFDENEKLRNENKAMKDRLTHLEEEHVLMETLIAKVE